MMRKLSSYIGKERDRIRQEKDAEVTALYGQGAHNMCGRKRTYYTSAEAERVAARYAHRYNAPCRTYHCPICDLWHITTKEADQNAPK